MHDRHIDEREAIARDLLDIGAVTVSPDAPFTWASGIQSPIYCDNRLTLSYPAIRSRITRGFRSIIEENGLPIDVVVGTATAGIPHAAWLASSLELPMAYVRSKAKEHGRRNQIEGIVRSGQRAVVVEDLVSTGGSVLTAVEAVRTAGATVEAVLAVFSYGFEEASKQFEAAKVPCYVLVTFDVLLRTARESGYLNEHAVSVLESWRRDPRGWR
jgi:orotate phosphoribosyltransferase